MGLDQLQHHLRKGSTTVEGMFASLPSWSLRQLTSCLLCSALTSDTCWQSNTFLIWRVLPLGAFSMPGIRMT